MANLNSNQAFAPGNVNKLVEKWSSVLGFKDFPKIKDRNRLTQTAIMLEQQEIDMKRNLQETAPTNTMGVSAADTRTGQVQGFDPVLISLVRRAMPNLIAYDLAGVQAMSGPTGLIFALRAIAGAPAGTAGWNSGDKDAFLNEVNTGLSGSGTLTQVSDPLVGFTSANSSYSNRYNQSTIAQGTGSGQTTAAGEGDISSEMSFTIDRIAVTAKTRNLKASYSIELAQDLKAMHGLDAESELVNILSAEVLAEINREVIRKINSSAKVGCKSGQTTNAGIFDLTVDAAGRHMTEKFKGLLFQLEREANVIGKETRRGRGNWILCSSDVASALAMTGVLSYTPDLKANLDVDDTGNTYAGTVNGRLKVYIDPYANNVSTGDYNYVTVGYRGSNPIDAGIFYCPYVPLQMVRAVDPTSLQPIIGFRTRYGISANPFVSYDGSAANAGVVAPNSNQYFRIFAVTNLLHTSTAQ